MFVFHDICWQDSSCKDAPMKDPKLEQCSVAVFMDSFATGHCWAHKQCLQTHQNVALLYCCLQYPPHITLTEWFKYVSLSQGLEPRLIERPTSDLANHRTNDVRFCLQWIGFWFNSMFLNFSKNWVVTILFVSIFVDWSQLSSGAD